jgi:multisubunit Na+/H+ antiporter MnhC subunit
MADPAPLPSVTSGTKALITAAIAISWAVMVFMVRMYIRFEVKKSFGADDIACAVAMVCLCLPDGMDRRAHDAR